MTMDIKVNGSSMANGRQLWGESVTVTEDATGRSLADSFGGTGSVTVTVDRGEGLTFAQGKSLEVISDSGGSVKGSVTSVNDTDGAVTLNGSTPIAKLNRTVKIGPTTTTLGAHLQAIFSRCGIGSSSYSIESAIANRSAALPGWKANAWQMLKEMGAVEGFEIASVDNVIVVRAVGKISADILGHSSLSEGAAEGTLGLFVETMLYGHKAITNALVYPPATYNDETGASTAPGWTADAPVIEVTPGQPVTLEVPIMASLSSVTQPTCVDWVDRDESGSVYCVTTNDGVRAVNPSTWTSRGGSVSVKIMEDTQTLKITVSAGWNDVHGAPYRLMLDDGKTEYSTLRITGTGVAWSKARLRQRTGIPEADTDNEIASATDSIFVRTDAQARRALLNQAQAASKAVPSLTVNIADLPLPFGQRAGAIVTSDHAKYRVRTATTSAFDVALTADAATTVGDHNAAMAGRTVAQVNANWAGEQVQAHNLSPLG